MNLRYLPLTGVLLLFVFLSPYLSAQTVFVDDRFETPAAWQLAGTTAPNSWITGTCAGNGSSAAGTKAAYISSGGTIAGCGPTGTEHYGYVNAPSGSLSVIYYRSVNANCATGLQAAFDAKIDGQAGADYLELVYSTNGGTTWNVTGTAISGVASWQAMNQSLPALLNNTTFLLGFRFTYDNATVTGLPAAIDNVRVSGTMTDTSNPVITCPVTQTATVGTNCSYTIPDMTAERITLTDNCTDSTLITLTQSPVAGTLLTNAAGLSTTITLIATDLNGNQGSCTFQLQTIDVTAPVATACPPNTTRYLGAGCATTVSDFTSQVVATDNCTAAASLILAQTPAANTVLSGIGTTQNVTITITDASGNAAQCAFTVTTADTTLPVITCPSPVSLYATIACSATLDNYIPLATVSDNCASSFGFTQSPPPGTVVSDTTVITITATGSPATPVSCSFTGLFIDTIKPTLDCPAAATIYVNAACAGTMPNLQSLVTFSDNCSSGTSLVFQQTPAIGTTLSASGSGIVTVIDAVGNQRSCAMPFAFFDTIKPTITCPAPITVPVTSGCDYTVADFRDSAVAVDNCTVSTALAFSQLPIIGSFLPVGDHTMTITVQDASGNPRSCAFTLSVTETTPPVINCPSSASVPATGGCNGTVSNVLPLVSATDNCSASTALVFSQNPVPGTAFTTSIPVTVTVTDLEGNSSNCTFNLHTADTQMPVISCLPDTSVAANAFCNYTIPDLSATFTASDNCSAANQLTFSQNPLPGVSGTGVTPVSVTITDASGNSATCVTHIHPIDNQPPSITCPATMTINNGTDCSYALGNYTGLASVSDNCTGLSVVQTPAAGNSVMTGMNSVTLTVIDAGGNEASCAFFVDVRETIPPAIGCPGNISTCNSLISYGAPIGTDNCNLFAITQTDNSGLTSGDLFPVGITTQTYTIIDSSGNIASCSFTIERLEAPDQAVISTDTIELCNTFTTTVSATPVTNGDGSWSVIQGTATFALATASTTAVSGLSIGVNKLRWTVSSPECGTSADTVNVIVYALPSPAATPDSITACSPTSLFLQATMPVIGTGFWTGPSGVIIDNPTAPVTAVSEISGGFNQFIWTVGNGTCPTSSDTLITHLPSIAQIYFPDTALCLEDFPFVLSGSVPVGEQSVIWSTVGNTNTASFSSKYTTPTTLNAANEGTVLITYAMVHPVCGITRDTVTLTVAVCSSYEPAIPTLFTPNDDGVNDVFNVPGLGITYPQCSVQIYNRWGGKVFESTGYLDPWDGTFKGEAVPLGTYFYHIELNDGEGTVFDGPISIIR